MTTIYIYIYIYIPYIYIYLIYIYLIYIYLIYIYGIQSKPIFEIFRQMPSSVSLQVLQIYILFYFLISIDLFIFIFFICLFIYLFIYLFLLSFSLFPSFPNLSQSTAQFTLITSSTAKTSDEPCQRQADCCF